MNKEDYNNEDYYFPYSLYAIYWLHGDKISATAFRISNLEREVSYSQ